MQKVKSGVCRVKYIGIGESNNTPKLKAVCPRFLPPQAQVSNIILMKKMQGTPAEILQR